jgi:hypothetical protein
MNYSIIAEPDTGIREGLMDALGSYNESRVGQTIINRIRSP